MRKLLAALLVVFIAFGGIYTAYWFKKSDEFKQDIVQIIAQINENAKTRKDIPTVKYESIDVSGFPFTMQFNINKPAADFSASEISKATFHTTPATPANVVIEAKYDRITIGTNVSADTFSLGTSGQTMITSLVDGTPGSSFEVETASPAVCYLKIHNTDHMPWNVAAAFADNNAFFNAFRSFDCNIDSAISKDTASGAPLSSVDSLQFSVASEPAGSANHKLALLIEIKNAKATPTYDTLINYYAQLLYDLAGTPQNQRNVNINISQYGTQNSRVDAHYEGPLEKEAILDPAATLRFELNALNFKNDLYELATEAHLSSQPTGTTKDGAVVIHWSMTAAEPYEHLLVQDVARTIRQATASNPEFAAQFAANPDDIAAALVPKLHSMGKISFDTNITAKGEPGKDFLKSGSFTISQLDLTGSQYGLKLKGTGKTGASLVPSGELFATCVMCDSMIDSLAGYITGVDTVLAKARPDQPVHVTPALVDGIKQFLHALDEPAADKTQGNILIHVVAPENGMPTISGKQFPEVISLYSTDIASNIPHSKPTPAPAEPAKKKSAK